MFPVAIKPPEIGSVSIINFTDLRHHKLLKLLPPGRIFSNFIPAAVFKKARIIRMAPVDQGEICTPFYILFVKCLVKWSKQVTLGRCIFYNAVMILFGGP